MSDKTDKFVAAAHTLSNMDVKKPWMPPYQKFPSPPKSYYDILIELCMRDNKIALLPQTIEREDRLINQLPVKEKVKRHIRANMTRQRNKQRASLKKWERKHGKIDLNPLYSKF